MRGNSVITEERAGLLWEKWNRMGGGDFSMNSNVTRRGALLGLGMAASAAAATVEKVPMGMKGEGADTPKICLEIGGGGLAAGGMDEGGMRRIKQLGVNHVIGAAGPIPWTEEKLRDLMGRLKTGGLTCGNIMIGGFNKAIYGRPGRDEEIEKVKESIVAAGKVGLPVVEYNWYAHRAMEGYYEVPGRAASAYTGFDYARMKDLPALENEGAHNLEEMWGTITYFLKAVVPVAEKAGVRLALHPNDPPAPVSRGSQQIMGTVEGWKRLIEIVPSKSNGITFDCGVTREMGHDPVEVCRYFQSRDRINHVHFRNVIVEKPYEHYEEVFIDEGLNNMYAVMKELVRQKYPRMVYPEHPRALDYDREHPGFHATYPGGGGYAAFAFNVGYARAMLQACLNPV
jgi:mannonate dehydratase